jgi:predicted transcriptional regulator
MRLATLDEAAEPLARLRAALADSAPVEARPPVSLLAVVRRQPSLALHELAAEAEIAVHDVERELRALARDGLVQAAAGEDGVMRWWAVAAGP